MLQEREEAVRIAQAYKSELEKIVISDKDIEHVQKTVINVIDLLKTFSGGTASENEQQAEMIKNLVSMDTLKTMQLLGFNYKEAIGDPLTQICADKITTWGKGNTTQQNNKPQRR